MQRWLSWRDFLEKALFDSVLKNKEKEMPHRKRSFLSSFFLVVLTLTMLFMNKPVYSQDLNINWVEGPQLVTLGNNIANLQLTENYVFAGAEDTKELMQAIGNPPSKAEVGIVMPKDENQDYYVVFEYFPVGYIKDDEKNDLDSARILKTIKRGTANANKERKEMGFSPLEIVGWYEEPHYDPISHNLAWAILAESEGDQIVNYEVRILGRQGYVSSVLVAPPETLSSLKPELSKLVGGFSYTEGKKYEQFIQGDKVAEYGLTALVAGGATAVAMKSGFFKVLAKAGKAIVLAVIAFLAAIGKFLKRIFGYGDAEELRNPNT